MARIRIGEMLVNLGRIDSDQLQSPSRTSSSGEAGLGDAIVHLGFLTSRRCSTRSDGSSASRSWRSAIGDLPGVLSLVPAQARGARRVLPLELSRRPGGPSSSSRSRTPPISA